MHRLKSYNVLALDTGWTAQLLVACVTVCISCSLVYGFGLGFCMEQRVHHDQLRDCLRTRIELVISKDITKSEVQFNSSLESNKTADRGITEDNAAKRKVRRSVSGGPNKGDMTREDCLAYSVERLMEVITHRNPLHHYKRRLDTDKEEDKLETMNSFLKAMAIYSLDINQAIEDCPDTLSPSVKDPLMTEQAGVVTSPQSDRRNVTDMNFTTSSSQEVSMTSATFGSEAAIVDQRQEKYEILSTKTLMSGKTTTVSPTPIARTSKQTHNIKMNRNGGDSRQRNEKLMGNLHIDNMLETNLSANTTTAENKKWRQSVEFVKSASAKALRTCVQMRPRNSITHISVKLTVSVYDPSIPLLDNPVGTTAGNHNIYSQSSSHNSSLLYSNEDCRKEEESFFRPPNSETTPAVPKHEHSTPANKLNILAFREDSSKVDKIDSCDQELAHNAVGNASMTPESRDRNQAEYDLGCISYNSLEADNELNAQESE